MGYRKLSKKEKQQQRIAYAFLLPNFLGFLCFVLIPAISAFIISFTKWDAFGSPKFIGLDNYVKLFFSETFKISLKNNIIYTLCYVPLTMLFALLTAMGLNKKLKGLSFFRCIYFLPHITAMVAVAMVWRVLLNPTKGPINLFLMRMGVENPPGWITSPKWALFAVIFMASWKSIGYYVVLMLGGLKGIPQDLYEAASLDGANSWQQFLHVTWPMLSPTTFMISVLAIISSFKVFDAINIMTEGGPGRSTNVIVYNIYKEGFKNLNFGYASSMAIILFLMILVVTLIQFKGEKKWVEYN